MRNLIYLPFRCGLNEVRIQDEVLCRKTSERDVSLNSSVPSKPAASPSGSSDFCFISKGFDTAAVDSPDSRCLQRLSSSPVLEASDLLVPRRHSDGSSPEEERQTADP